MTNTIKLSLAAALVATSVSAVEFSTSGNMKVEYEFGTAQSSTSVAGTGTSEFDYDIDAKVQAKFSDNWTAVASFEADQDVNTETAAAKLAVNESDHYVVYTQGGTTVSMGRQGLKTTMFDDEKGNGVVAATKLGAVTVAGAMFNGISVDADENLNVIAGLGSVAGVNVNAYYADYQNQAKLYTVDAATSIEGVKLSALVFNRTNVTETTSNDDQGLMKVAASTSVAGFDLGVKYAKTGTDGSGLLVDDTASDITMEQLELYGSTAETKFTVLSAGTKLGAAGVVLTHGKQNIAGSDNASATQLKVTYPLASGASLAALYSSKSVGSTDTTSGYVALKFKF